MPREVIKDRGNTPFPLPSIEVGWGRDKSVQLGTVAPTDAADPSPGWFVPLDRHQINDLIRVLRKARDQAYGADA